MPLSSGVTIVALVDANGAFVGAGAPLNSDVSDRAARLLGVIANFPAAVLLGDAVANPTTAMAGSPLMVFNGTTWERARTAVAAPVTGVGVQTVNAGTGVVTSFAAGSSAIANGTALSMGSARIKHIMVLTTVGTPTAGTVQLQGSLDGVDWFPLGAAQSPVAAGVSFVAVSDIPAIQVRAAITVAFVGGTILAKIASSS